MAIIIQLLVFLLILLYIILVVSIPVILALPGKWDQSKNLIYTGTAIWSAIVIITGIVNSFNT